MELFITILTWLGYLFAIIGFFATVYKSIQPWLSIHKFSWREFDKYVKKLIDKIDDDNYIPDVIVTIGRGGAVLGAVLSGNLARHGKCPEKSKRNIPLLGTDRIYEWDDGQRHEIPNKMVDFSPLRGKKVLLVAADVLTGGTMEFFNKQIRKVQTDDLRTACLVKGMTSAYKPKYHAKEIPSDCIMPWMYKGYGYVRDSRCPTEKKVNHNS